jgi:hypothetical protein
MNPYIMQMQQPQQDIGGLNPVFQNIGMQQANQNAAIQQGQQMAQQAAQSGQQGGGMNPMAMAMMLRKGKPDQAAVNAKDAQMGGLGTYNPLTQYDISQKYGTDPYSQSSRMLAAQESGMGFNSSPVNNMPVVGAYGQLLPNN